MTTNRSRNLFGRVIDVQFLPAGGGSGLRYRFRDTTGLGISFEVKRKQAGRANKAVITIDNLAPATVGFIESGDVLVTLSAGYKSNARLLFTGSIAARSLVTTFQGNTRETRIEASASAVQIELSRFDASFEEGATVGLVLRSIADAMGLGRGNLEELPDIDLKQYGAGAVFTGPARDALDEVTAQIGVTWSVQDGALQFLASDEPSARQAVLLNTGSGLVGEPKRVKGGVEGVSLLQPEIIPGGIVKIEARALSGFYKVTEVKHAGTYRGGDFLTTFKGKEIGS